MTEEAHPRVNISQIGGVDVDQLPALPVSAQATATAAEPASAEEGTPVGLSTTLPRRLRVDSDATRIAGVAIATAAPGVAPVSEVLQNLSGPTLCWSAVAPGLGAGLLDVVPCAESLAAANRWQAIPAGCRFVRFTAILSGAGAPTGVVLQPMYSPDLGTTAKPIPLVKSVTTRVAMAALIAEIQGADGAATVADGWLPPLLVPREEIPANATHVSLRSAKNGGGAGTALLAYVAFEG
jgi:hypothetical protein